MSTEESWAKPDSPDHWGYPPAEQADEALEALHEYHEKPATDDEVVRSLLARVDDIELDAARHRRHEELVGRAVGQGRLSSEVAEEAYQIALDEGLEPAYGLELVASGVGIVVEEPSTDAPAHQSERPDFVEVAPPAAAARRERSMREMFRRLRSLLEEREPRDAFRSLLEQPDIGRRGY